VARSTRGGDRLLPEGFLDQFKYEVANELGVLPKAQQIGWAEVPSKEWGRVGGHIGGRMVRVMIKHAEEAMAGGVIPPRE